MFSLLEKIEAIHIPTPEEIFRRSEYLASPETVLSGKTFKHRNIPVALQQALDYAGPLGGVATLPELIAAKVSVGKNHPLWKYWYGAHTEEVTGFDIKGQFSRPGNRICVVVHGGGLLTPERIASWQAVPSTRRRYQEVIELPEEELLVCWMENCRMAKVFPSIR